jgi:hypothetical protein
MTPASRAPEDPQEDSTRAHPTHEPSPPPKKTNRQWLVVAIKTPSSEIVRSQGLDALVMVQSLAIGVQLFAPMAVIGVVVLLPLHYRAAERRGGLIGLGGSDEDGLDRSALMRLTIASLPQGSALAW